MRTKHPTRRRDAPRRVSTLYGYVKRVIDTMTLSHRINIASGMITPY